MNSTNIPNSKIDFVPRCRLSVQTFDPRAEDSLRDKPPAISKAAQNRLLRETIQNLQKLGFNACALHTAQNFDAKTFSLCFSFAVARIDPNFKFSKKWDEDMIRVLKYFRYPFSLKRNDLYDLTNGSQWPLVLNSLHFLVSLALHASNFPLSAALFEKYDPNCELLAKCKWDFIFESLNPATQNTALTNLEFTLKNIESQFQTENDLTALSNELDRLKSSISAFDTKKAESDELDNRVSLLTSQINKIEERSKDIGNLINILKDQSNKLQQEIIVENNKKIKLKEQLDGISNVVKNQAIDSASVAMLNNQMQLSKKRILELTTNCESLKESQTQIETKIRQVNFQIQDNLSSLSSKMMSLRNEMENFDNGKKDLFNFDFNIKNWQAESMAFSFKESTNNIKKQLQETLNKQFIQKSSLEKEICEKNVDLIGLNDLRQELMRKVVEVDNQYKMSEKNAKGMLSDALVHNEDSILRLSNDKWSLKKQISDVEAEIMLLESKLKAKEKMKKRNSDDLNRHYNQVIRNTYNKILTAKEIVIDENKKADIFINNVLEYVMAFEQNNDEI